MRAKLREVKEELQRRMHQPIPEQGKRLKQVVSGFFNYHAVPTNGAALEAFRYYVTILWRRSLRRRSQRDALTWERMGKLANDWLPRPRTLHPWPSDRFAVRHPRWEKLWDQRRGEMTPSPSKTPDGERRVSATAERLEQIPTTLDQDGTLIAVIEMSQSSWLVAGTVPGIERQPLKKLAPDEAALFRLLQRWQDEAARSGRTIARVTVSFEAGRDGFWLARWLRSRGIEAHVIHSTSVAISREHRRAKTDRLDTAMLMRVFLGWLRGERGHCRMVAVPTIEEEDARRPNREHESLVGEPAPR